MPFVNSVTGTFSTQSGVISRGLILDLITGGTITTSGDYRIHTFTSSGVFSSYTPLQGVEYLLVGGGGNGYVHPDYGGGGGGGGQVKTNTLSTSGPFNITVTVGGPGTASSWVLQENPQAADSAAAGTPAPPPGRDSRAGGTSGNGNLGADYSNSGYTGGGGGGAGAAAASLSPTGGAGVQSSISGTATFYGGGGGSGAVNRPPYTTGPKHSPTPAPGWAYGYGVGGIGGGGNAPDNPGVYNGKPGTGGGASGSSAYGYNTQHTGGPGIVIIRYRYK